MENSSPINIHLREPPVPMIIFRCKIFSQVKTTIFLIEKFKILNSRENYFMEYPENVNNLTK